MRQKFITKYVRFFITKCDSFITKCNSYFKLRRFYYKIRQLLQNVMFITNWHSTRCSRNMQHIYRRTSMQKCDFNKVPLKSYMDVLLQIWYIFSEHLFLGTHLEGCFWIHLVCFQYAASFLRQDWTNYSSIYRLDQISTN